jgi:Ca2+:H+ antiporter
MEKYYPTFDHYLKKGQKILATLMGMDAFFKVLLFAIPLALAAAAIGASAPVIFFTSALAIIPLAKYIGEATEELAARTNTALGGLLNVTFGNATELIIGVIALNAGLIDVVKASITGSIIGNLLLVLGMAVFFGGLKRERQKFNSTAAKVSASTLLLVMTSLAIPAIFLFTSPGVTPAAIEDVSVIGSLFLLLAYGASLLFALRTHTHLYVGGEVAKYEPRWSTQKSLWILVGSTIGVAVLSEILVGSIEPLVESFGWTQLFIGVIFVAIIGNAAEHASAITVALRDKMDLSLQIATGSATQIAMFVTPALVLLSLALGRPMNLVFDTFELACMLFSVFVVNAIIEDGESNWLEGFQLLIAYAVMAVAFFFHP